MIQAIETKYDGHKFRSRLEARWALFFNFVGLKWEYEREAFTVDMGEDYGVRGFTPDFWLPDLGFWFEVKAESGSYEEDVFKELARKSFRFVSQSQATLCVSFGAPRDGDILRKTPSAEGVDTVTWARCSQCLAWDLGLDEYEDRPCGHTSDRIGHAQAEGALLDATAYRFWEPKSAAQTFKGQSKYERGE